MKNLKIIIKGNESIYTELLNCEKVDKPTTIDYDISDQSIPERNYYKLTFRSNSIKFLSTNGKVEMYDDPVLTKVKEWAEV